MSVPILANNKSHSKTFKKFESIHSVERPSKNIHRRLMTELNPLPRMKTVRIITKHSKFTRKPQQQSTINIQRPFRSPEKKVFTIRTKTNSKYLNEISPIIPVSFVFPNNRLDESRLNPDDTLAIIFEDLS